MLIHRPSRLSQSQPNPTRRTQQFRIRRVYWASGVLIGSFLTFLACGSPEYNPVKLEMQTLYRPAYDLFTIVWAPKQFSQPAEHDHILALLKTLTRDFHKVGKAADLRSNDPGIATTLDVTQRLLEDAKRRFEAGDTDYARWRLKGLVSSCVSCHTRKQPTAPFYGAAPVAEPQNFDSALNVAEFLIASRQFEEAGDRLYHLAERASQEPQLATQLVPVLRMWLLIRVRVTQGSPGAVEELAKLGNGPTVNPETKKLLLNWTEELRAIENVSHPASPVDTAESLLAPVRSNTFLAKDDWNLVKTLRASNILHEYLEGGTSSASSRQRGTLLLAISYQHMNISAFAPLRDLYLERCIRAFPGSPEAKEAFQIYQWNVKDESSGSGGVHLDEFDKKLMEELSKIANHS